jgi:hypothetical protein
VKLNYIIRAAVLTICTATATTAVAGTAFLKSEQISGMNKICYYDELGSTVAITIGATELCPLSINT